MVLDVVGARRAFESENIEYWTMRSSSYSAQHRGELAGEQRLAWACELAGRLKKTFPGRSPEELRVLDVGAGPGFFSIQFSLMGCRVFGIDYTESMLDEARRNASAEGCDARFLHMDAEELAFPDGAFDVVVSRNLTWNLPHPDRAYAEWVRVLKAGGLLLNYDANWYAYLNDPDLLCAHEKDRANAARAHLRDRTQLGDPVAMESIAAEAPLSFVSRPAWDLSILEALGMSVQVDLRVSDRVWTEEELVSQASTPLFCVMGRRSS